MKPRNHQPASRRCLLLGVTAGLACAAAAAAGQPTADGLAFFENRIRPVLSKYCYECHSATAKRVGGGLKLDRREDLLKGGIDGVVVIPGDPDNSLLIKAVNYQDKDLQMPPKKSGGTRLPDPVIADLIAWVAMGAPFPETPADQHEDAPPHWAFTAPQNPPLPPVHNQRWPVTSMDRFILAKMEASKTSPAPPADKLTLIRRASYSLTGLPPSPAETDAFLADEDPDAFAKVVDRLLASPHYGEHWGRHWLDVARYADTAGDTADYPLPEAWRYRNYVINSLNADKPYDLFLKEQLAGDILASRQPAERYAEQVSATGYLALSRRFGFDSEHYQHLTIQDSIDTIGQSVMALTIGCARCHDHKFDPISARDYYSLYGIFASTRYAFPGSEQKTRFRSVVPLVPREESQLQWREMQAGFAANGVTPEAVLRSLDEIDGDFEMQRFASGGSYGVPVAPWHFSGPVAITQTAQSPFKHLHPFGAVGAGIPAGAVHSLFQALHPVAREGRLFFNLEFRLSGGEPASPGHHRLLLGPRTGPAAVEILISATALTIIGDPQPLVIPITNPGEWQCLQLVLDLDSRSFSGTIGTPAAVQPLPRTAMAAAAGSGIGMLRIESDGNGTPGIELDNVGAQATAIAPVATTPLPAPPATEPTVELNAGLQQLQHQLAHGPVPIAYGVTEGTPQNARIQMRGEPDRPGEEVPRGFIEILGKAAMDSTTDGSGRLELANWLVRRDHPLTARVMANRLWQHHFGRGLVATPNDFGTRSEPPSHPELLDHLAHQLIDSNWSLKRMHRLILLSATWQQACAADGAPSDHYASFSRRRLSAEEIRDSILLVSGMLDATPGETHPFPPPPTWSFTQHQPFDAVYDHQKRSVYLMVQRLKRHPFLTLFDGADPNSSTARRGTTTVATQALFFLNDPFIHTASLEFVDRLHQASPAEDDQLALAYRLALGRQATAEELTSAAGFTAVYRDELSATGVTDPEPAALAAFLRTLFSSNEFLHCD